MTIEQETELLNIKSKLYKIIQLTVVYPDSSRTYSYVGIRINELWFLTSVYGGRTWKETIAWLKDKNAKVTSLWFCSEMIKLY